MGWNRFVGITMLLYGLINPVGVIPIYLPLVNRAVSARAHRVLLIASTAVADLLIAAAIFGRRSDQAPRRRFFATGTLRADVTALRFTRLLISSRHSPATSFSFRSTSR